MTQHYHGYSGNNYDRWVERNSNSSALGKVQKQFWFTKSAVMRKFGKSEDEYIVASDAELDAKVDLFTAIESSTRELQILLADYQNKICILAQEENTLGRLLKEYGKQDQTRAGKMMLAVGKSLSYTAQQRVALRNPLVRLFQEVDTFQSRAVEDTSHTVEEMEKIRTEYRGALMWMKNISQDFNPDHYQQLEKFREVQTLVKQKKSKFDQIKIKSLQKIELLAASRCNMFSHALILYQNNLITFSEKTAKTLNTVASNFKGYAPYKFHVIKELAEPEELTIIEEESKDDANLDGDDKTFFGAEYHDEDLDGKMDSKHHNHIKNRATKYKKQEEKLGKDSDSLMNLFNNEESDLLISVEREEPSSAEMKSVITSFANVDLLTQDAVQSDISANTMDELKELFDSPIHMEPKQALPVFGSGNTDSSASPLQNEISQQYDKDGVSKAKKPSQMFLPSHLLDFGLNEYESPKDSEAGQLPSKISLTSNPGLLKPTASTTAQASISAALTSNPNIDKPKMTTKSNNSSKNRKQDTAMVDWYKVFQDIDPLADPGSAIFGKAVDDRKC